MWRALGAVLRRPIVDSLSTASNLHTSAAAASVFMKKQKRIDPELAKTREMRRRRKLEREIRAMQQHAKKPRPVEELQLDVHSAKNIEERRRVPVVGSETEAKDEERRKRIISQAFAVSRARLQCLDDAWLRRAVENQRRALAELKALRPDLYEAAVQSSGHGLPVQAHGPTETAPIRDYEAPDGDYIDTTRTWT